MTSAFLFINAELLFIEDVINKLKEVPEIVDVYKVQGIYDIKLELIQILRRY
jgi:hypothetical protein